MISNTLPTVAGQTYRLTFAYRGPGMVSWWRGEDSNANDCIGTNNGIVSSELTYTNGEVGQAFSMTGTNSFFHVPASPGLNAGLGGGFTIDAWINPSDVNGFHPIAEWGQGVSGGSIGASFWIGGYPWSLGALSTVFTDTNGNNYIKLAPDDTLVPNTFQHVALTYDRTSHTIKLYVNGAIVNQSPWSGDVPQTSYDLWVDRRPFDNPGDWTYGTYLTGPLDELSLYSRALSDSEIQAIYQKGTAGKFDPGIFNSSTRRKSGRSPGQSGQRNAQHPLWQQHELADSNHHVRRHPGWHAVVHHRTLNPACCSMVSL